MIERDWRFFKKCLDSLTTDVYVQPPDPGHTEWALEALDMVRTTAYVDREIEGQQVLDVGCGWGFMAEPFEYWGFEWNGVTIGDDFKQAQQHLSRAGKDPTKVIEADMSFLPYPEPCFDLIFARHVLEHSPFPVITLMEWRRVTKENGWLCLVAPAPHWWKYGGMNHYSLVPQEALEFWLKRSGWKPIHYFTFDNRNPSFLKHLEVYQSAISGLTIPGDIAESGKKILDRYPPGPVEYRIICQRSEEVVT